MTHSLKRRLSLNFAAGVGSQFVTVLQQLISVPVLLLAWGPEAYGVWITLVSVETYVQTIAAFGFANLAASEIGLRRAANDEAGSLMAFQSIFRLTIFSVIPLLILAAVCAWVVPVDSLLGIPGNYGNSPALLLAVLILGEPFTLLGTLACGVYRGHGLMARGVFYWYVVARLIETLGMLAAALCGAGLLVTATTSVAVRAVCCALILLRMRREIGWIRYGTGQASWNFVRQLLWPAVGHMAIPVSMVMNVAGVNLVVFLAMGAEAVAALSVIRTFGNLAFQAFNMLVQALWPEVSSLIGSGQLGLARRLIQHISRASLWVVLLVAILLLAAADPVFRLWTNDTIAVHWGLLVMQLVAILSSCAWRVPSILLMATNRTGRMGLVVLAASTLNVVLASVLQGPLGLTGVGVSLAVTEVSILTFVLRDALAVVDLRVGPYLRRVLSPPTVSDIRKTLREARPRGAEA